MLIRRVLLAADWWVSRWLKMTSAIFNDVIQSSKAINISIGYCKKDVTPLQTHWSSVFLALTHWYLTFSKCIMDSFRDHFVYVPSQWKATLQCNVVSHWLAAYTKWSLFLGNCIVIAVPADHLTLKIASAGKVITKFASKESLDMWIDFN